MTFNVMKQFPCIPINNKCWTRTYKTHVVHGFWVIHFNELDRSWWFQKSINDNIYL